MINNIIAGNDTITADDLKELKETFHLFCFGGGAYLFSFHSQPSLPSFISKPSAVSSLRILSLVAQSLLALAFMRSSSNISTTLPKATSRIIAGNDTITADDLKELKETFHLFCFDILGLKEENNSNEEREVAFGKVVDMLLEERMKAKANKDWATSDNIRMNLQHSVLR